MAGGFNLGDVFVTFKAKTEGFKQAIADTRLATQQVHGHADSLNRTGGIAGVAKNALGALWAAAKVGAVAATAALGGLGLMGIKSAADLEKTAASMRVLTGNAQVANQLFAQLYKYAATTPFEFPDIAKGAKTLLGFGIQADKVMGHIRMLGDLAGATGADFSQLATVFGQVNATGRLMGQDALQLVNNNIPITTILAKKLGISVQEVKKRMEEGAISADLFNQALLETTQQGGFAFQGAEQLGRTFSGRLSTLKDQVREFAMQLIGVKIDPELGLVVEPGGLFDRLSKAIPVVIEFLKEMGTKVNELKDQFSRALQPVVDYILPKLQQVWNDLKSSFTPEVIEFWKIFAEILLGAVVVAITVVAAAIMGFVTGLNLLIQGAIAAITWVGNAFADGWNWIKNTTTDAWNWVKAQVQGGLDFIRGYIAWSVATIIAVWNGIRSIIGVVAGAIGGVISAIVGGLSGAVGAVLGFVGRFVQVGGDIVRGIANGIRGAAGAVIDAITGVVGDGISWAKRKLGIESPSKVFAAIGRDMMRGMAVGIVETAGMVTSALDRSIPTSLDVNGQAGMSAVSGAGGAGSVAAGGGGGDTNFNIYPQSMNEAELQLAASFARTQLGQRLKAGV